jgi:hypothetical protein
MYSDTQETIETESVTEPRKLVRIGELLTIAGIVSPEQLREGLRRAAETDLPLGKILVWSGYVSDELLRSAVHVQALLNDKAIDISDAAAWLAREAGKEIGGKSSAKAAESAPAREIVDKEIVSSRLGELLLLADMVDEAQLEEALADSSATGLPLGRVLVYTKNVPDHYISAALDAQASVRERRINREAALDALRMVRQQGVSFDRALANLGFTSFPNGAAQFVSLLRVSGVLSEAKLATAQEMAETKGRPLTEILVEFKFLPERVVKTATQTCNELLSGVINMSKALAMVKRSVETNFEVNETPSMPRSESAVSAADLLKLARLIDADQIRKVTPAELQAFSITNSRAENVDNTLQIALKCVELIEKKYLSLEQAIVVLHYCCRKALSLPVVLELMGISVLDEDL